MKIAVVGLSHHTAPIAIREQLAQHMREVPERLADFRSMDEVQEVCIVSTCNRLEVYVAGAGDVTYLARRVRAHLRSISGLASAELDPHLYEHVGVAALQHLFRVASSLDSMVLGEPQILGQIKDAFRVAVDETSIGPHLLRSFERAFMVAKRVRTETGIGENAISMSFAAVELGRQIFDSLVDKKVLLVGAGKMSTLAARHLMAHGVSEVRVASRSLATAQRLASEIGGLASSLTDLPMLLGSADIVICSTAAPHHIIDKKMMARVLRERRYRSILLVDMAVPRDVDPKVTELDNVFVYDVDDLQTVLDDNRATRAREAKAAEDLIEQEVGAFERWHKSQQVVPVIKALRQFALEIALKESERTLANVPSPDKKTIQTVRAMGQAIVNKLLHPALANLKAEGARGDPEVLADALVRLFELDLSRGEQDTEEGRPEANTGEANPVVESPPEPTASQRMAPQRTASEPRLRPALGAQPADPGASTEAALDEDSLAPRDEGDLNVVPFRRRDSSSSF
ncbi:MAG: glutamyl-tRNA reductase [Deltaproteobacteria bacterium]|nr:glutamyl-tRNA reductase [Deltaproteobacteria bacterium]